MTDHLATLCWFDASSLLVGAIAVLRMRWHGAGRELLGWLLLSSLAVGLATWLGGLHGGGFGMLRGACHGLFCVWLPLLALRATRLRHPAPRWAAAALTLALLGEGCYLWATEVEPFRLEVTRERVSSPKLAGLPRPLRLVAVADLQAEAVGPWEVAVFDALVAEQPDLVVFLGDYLQQYDTMFAAEQERLAAQLHRLAPPLGMFAVEGDVETYGTEVVFRGTPVRVLHDTTAALPDLPIDVIGLSRQRSRRTALDIGVVRHLGGARFPIVIGHAPDYMRSVLDGGLTADALFLAGHTHGGQVQVPGIGPLITLSSVPRWLAGGGIFHHGSTWLGVSRGIGMERDAAPRIRFWCRPQLLVLELHAPPPATPDQR